MTFLKRIVYSDNFKKLRMNIKLIALILSIGVVHSFKSQIYQKNILTFDISEATDNGSDISDYYKTKNAIATFYKNYKDSTFNMAIIILKDSSMSFGPITTHPIKVTNELYEGYKTEKTYYQWYFINSYNNDKGWAEVEFSIVYNSEIPFYVLRIITIDKFEIITFKGYLNESLTGLVTEKNDG